MYDFASSNRAGRIQLHVQKWLSAPPNSRLEYFVVMWTAEDEQILVHLLPKSQCLSLSSLRLMIHYLYSGVTADKFDMFLPFSR